MSNPWNKAGLLITIPGPGLSICICYFCDGKLFHNELFLWLKRILDLWVITLHRFPTQLQVIFKNPKECSKLVPKMSRWAHLHTTPINRVGQACAAWSAHHIHTPRRAGIPILPPAWFPATGICTSPCRPRDYRSVFLLIYLSAVLYITITSLPHLNWLEISIDVNCRAWPLKTAWCYHSGLISLSRRRGGICISLCCLTRGKCVISFRQGFQFQRYWHFGPDHSLWRGCPVHCRIFSSIPGLYPLDASSTSRCNNQKCLQTLSNGPWGTNCLRFRTTSLDFLNLWN